jgi:plastocyanin
MRPMRVLLLTLGLCEACLPQVGPPVDAGAGGGDASVGGGSGTGGGALATGGGTAAVGGGGGGGGGATAAGGGFVDTGCPGFAGCLTFVDLTDPAAVRTVHFPVGGNRYSPECIRVSAGQTVTFAGDFSNHPLVQECGPAAQVLGASNGSSAAFPLSAPGTYGYYCMMHGSPSGSGMSGAIEVVR